METKDIDYTDHEIDANLFTRAGQGEPQAVYSVLKYLSTANPDLRRIFQKKLSGMKDTRVWMGLLHCLAFRSWNSQLDCGVFEPPAWERIDQSISEIFTRDTTGKEKPLKNAVLQGATADPAAPLRHAAAYLLGLRGDLSAILLLEECIEIGSIEWKLRAVSALASLKDERCGPPLVKALALDRGALHRVASKALKNLGGLAQAAWLEALGHPSSHIRWHAARGLGESGDASAASVLAEGLYDENREVRWATADVLARLGAPAVPAILSVLSRHRLNQPFNRAAYHALNGIRSRRTKERVKPVLDALSSLAADVEAPATAQRTLLLWKEGE